MQAIGLHSNHALEKCLHSVFCLEVLTLGAHGDCRPRGRKGSGGEQDAGQRSGDDAKARHCVIERVVIVGVLIFSVDVGISKRARVSVKSVAMVVG